MPKRKVHIGGYKRGGSNVHTHPRRGGSVHGYSQRRASGKSSGR